jgi:hypothetical protein
MSSSRLSAQPTVAQLAATETLAPTEARREHTEVQLAATEAQLAATETLAPTEARREHTEAQLAATEASPAPAEAHRQAQECSRRTQQPKHQRDQPMGHSVRQQQELEEPSPPHMDWSCSKGREDAIHNSRRATPPDKTAAGVWAMAPTDGVRGRGRTGN